MVAINLQWCLPFNNSWHYVVYANFQSLQGCARGLDCIIVIDDFPFSTVDLCVCDMFKKYSGVIDIEIGNIVRNFFGSLTNDYQPPP